MAACQVCISAISVFALDHAAAANCKNFSTDESITFDESTSAAGIDSSDTEIDEMVSEATEKKAQKKRGQPQKQPRKKSWLFKWNSLFIKRNKIKNFRRCFVIDLNNKENRCRRTTKRL